MKQFTKERQKAFSHAVRGAWNFLKNETHAKIHFIAFLLTMVLGLYFGLSAMEWVVICIVSGLVFSVEMLNSAMEVLLDKLHPETDPKIGLAKDIAAGAVLVASVAALVTGLIIFVPYFRELF